AGPPSPRTSRVPAAGSTPCQARSGAPPWTVAAGRRAGAVPRPPWSARRRTRWPAAARWRGPRRARLRRQPPGALVPPLTDRPSPPRDQAGEGDEEGDAQRVRGIVDHRSLERGHHVDAAVERADDEDVDAHRRG